MEPLPVGRGARLVVRDRTSVVSNAVRIEVVSAVEVGASRRQRPPRLTNSTPIWNRTGPKSSKVLRPSVSSLVWFFLFFTLEWLACCSASSTTWARWRALQGNGPFFCPSSLFALTLFTCLSHPINQAVGVSHFCVTIFIRSNCLNIQLACFFLLPTLAMSYGFTLSIWKKKFSEYPTQTLGSHLPVRPFLSYRPSSQLAMHQHTRPSVVKQVEQKLQVEALQDSCSRHQHYR